MAVSKRARFEVMRRDNHTCRYCGGTAPDVVITVDHVTPIALGGSDDPGNLVVACRDCNAGKASTVPTVTVVQSVTDADIKWAGAIKRAAALTSAETDELELYYGAFLDAWGCRSIPSGYESTLKGLRTAGLPESQMRDAVFIALAARGVETTRYRYFCGVAWKKVERLQEMARAILAVEESGE
jgi:hypothetical protein